MKINLLKTQPLSQSFLDRMELIQSKKTTKRAHILSPKIQIHFDLGFVAVEAFVPDQKLREEKISLEIE